jgi:hypothetical protein
MTDETTPQDSAAMPPASAGSRGPVAWAVFCDGKIEALCETRKDAETRVEFWLDVSQIRTADDAKIVPLFALSEAEVDALEYVVVEGRIACKQDYGILRSLLIGLRPEEGNLRNGSADCRETVQ